jgi:hypothetical protein
MEGFRNGGNRGRLARFSLLISSRLYENLSGCICVILTQRSLNILHIIHTYIYTCTQTDIHTYKHTSKHSMHMHRNKYQQF